MKHTFFSAVDTGKQRSLDMERIGEGVLQSTIALPYLNEVVPVLYLGWDKPFIPVRAVCNVLGINADRHIQRWRTLLLWRNARKLPFKTSRGKCLVWCLHLAEVPFLYGCFNWSGIAPARCEQMERAIEETAALTARVYSEMQRRYRESRRMLFRYLTSYADLDETFARFARLLRTYIASFADREGSTRIETLLNDGKVLLDEATTHARAMLEEQAALPVIDVVSLNAEGEIIDEFSQPLLPIAQKEEHAQFFQYLMEIGQWYEDLSAFLASYGLLWDTEQKRWYQA
jgi:hypothetical protein